MNIDTSDTKTIEKIFSQLHLSESESHKGQNGRVLIIGGSSLFHAASIWAAEVASHFVDIVHYSSTKENNEIVTSLKKKFMNGIVIPHSELEHYVKEDNAILIGPGMMRGETDEAKYSYSLTKDLIKKHSDKKYVFDAGVLQMMDPEWLLELQTPSIITPHQIEFEKLFKTSVRSLPLLEKAEFVRKISAKYNTIILLKAIVDIISDGKEIYIVKGGNQGLTKGGSGDTLAGLAVSFMAKESALLSALFSSILLKRTADELLKEKGYWYNISDIIQHIPVTMRNIIKLRYN